MPWVKGSPSGLTSYLLSAETRFRDEAFIAMHEAVHVGEEHMKSIIKTSTTETGEARAGGVKSGPRDAGYGEAGRIESKEMYDAVTSDVDVHINTIRGRFGWLDGGDDYFLYQEDGTERVPAMHALLGAFLTASEELYGTMSEIVR
jgi:hypothetical protein